MDRNDALREINKQDPGVFLRRAKKRGWICPKCGNGSGKDGDGIVKNPKDGKYKCFKCGIGGDVLDLVGAAFGLTDFNDQFDKAVELYGIDVDKYRPALTAQQKGQAADTISRVAAASDETDAVGRYLEKCHAAAGQTDYFTKRGISQESVDRFQLGYDPSYDEGNVGGRPWKAVVIPTSADTYEVRNTEVEPNSDTNGRNKYRKHGKNHLFNLRALSEEKDKPIVICEGIFDAISIIQSGGQAIGLGSAVNYKYLVEALDKVTPAKPLIILFDSDAAGRDNAGKLAAELSRRNISYLLPEDALGAHHDVNDYLLKDPEGLKGVVAKIYSEAAAIPDPKEEAREKYLKTSAGQSIKSFIETIKRNANRPRLSTGFKVIDDALDGGIYTGLYVIGAISSLGKTTLTLQIADNLAQQGRDVLFFTLEQSKDELIAKSISRETFLCCRRMDKDTASAKSSRAILDGRRWLSFSDTDKDVLSKAFTAYTAYADHIFYHEGIGNIAVAQIREAIKTHISFTGNARPIVFIDYLQILKAAEGFERATDKQIVDHNITELKQLSRDFDIPILAVSSLNRQSYSGKITMSAFKESGAIEYGSDVLIGLQLTGSGEKDFDADAAKEKDIRDIDLCILKNRTSKIYPDGFPMSFYAVFNCFVADSTDKKEPDGELDGFTELSKTDEDNIPFID